jgi:hypothetical protein
MAAPKGVESSLISEEAAMKYLTAVTAATSFTINLGTITTNPECFSYFIVNQ